ncbi:MAG: Gfo/Idh/MocA family protein [Acidimicrobiales bacterium]
MILRIGFVGCGLIARAHAAGLDPVRGAVIGPVYDVDGERATRFAADVGGADTRVVGSVESVIDDCDAVYVCTWTAAHPGIVRAAAEAGRAVFCEKPLATGLAEATAMTETVTGAGVTNQVGLVLRGSPAFRWLINLLGRPEVGPVMNVVFRDDQYLPTQGMYGSVWRGDPARAGAGTLLEHSIHDLDLLRWMLGPITSVSALTGSTHGITGIEDQATVMLVSASGAQAALVSVWHEVLSRPSQRRVEVFCRDATITLEGDWWGPVGVEWPDGETQRWAGEELAAVAADADGLAHSPDAGFVAAVAAGETAHPDFTVALAAHVLADAAYRSAASAGAPVRPNAGSW